MRRRGGERAAGFHDSEGNLPGIGQAIPPPPQAGAMAAGGTFTAADGTTHVEVCTSPDGKTWQATDLGRGGDEPHGGPPRSSWPPEITPRTRPRRWRSMMPGRHRLAGRN